MINWVKDKLGQSRKKKAELAAAEEELRQRQHEARTKLTLDHINEHADWLARRGAEQRARLRYIEEQGRQRESRSSSVSADPIWAPHYFADSGSSYDSGSSSSCDSGSSGGDSGGGSCGGGGSD